LCENRGYDIGPFFYALNKVNLDSYKYIIKLHTKNTSSRICGNINGYPLNDKQFSDILINALIGTPLQVNRNIQILEKNKKTGMLGSRICLTGEKFYYNRYLDKTNEVLSFLNLKTVKKVECVAGTMFMARADCFKVFQNKIDISCFEKTDANIKDGTLAHVYERVFGAVVQSQSYKLKGVGHTKIKYFLKKLHRLFYRKKISREGNITVQVLFFPVYRKSLLSKDEKLMLKSGLFDTHWYADKYLKDKRRRCVPVRHYLRVGKKKGFYPNKSFNVPVV